MVGFKQFLFSMLLKPLKTLENSPPKYKPLFNTSNSKTNCGEQWLVGSKSAVVHHCRGKSGWLTTFQHGVTTTNLRGVQQFFQLPAVQPGNHARWNMRVTSSFYQSRKLSSHAWVRSCWKSPLETLLLWRWSAVVRSHQLLSAVVVHLDLPAISGIVMIGTPKAMVHVRTPKLGPEIDICSAGKPILSGMRWGVDETTRGYRFVVIAWAGSAWQQTMIPVRDRDGNIFDGLLEPGNALLTKHHTIHHSAYTIHYTCYHCAIGIFFKSHGGHQVVAFRGHRRDSVVGGLELDVGWADERPKRQELRPSRQAWREGQGNALLLCIAIITLEKIQ